MANKLRGEVELAIGDELLTLRPTYTSIVEIESRLGDVTRGVGGTDWDVWINPT